jgi:predicted small lipoprotein YifL
LRIQVGIGLVIDAVTIAFHRTQQSFCAVHEFRVGHYNFTMLKARQILFSMVALGACVLNLSACGQTGDLYIPSPANTPKAAKATEVRGQTPSVSP